MTAGMRVISWNLHGSARPNLAAVAMRLRDARPDIVGLQEVQSRQAAQLAEALGWHHVWARKHFPYTPLLWRRAEGMAVMSPHSLRDHERFVLNEGTSSWSYRRRIAQRVTVDVPGIGAVRHYNTHLASEADGAADRTAQAAVVAGRVAEDRLRRRSGDGPLLVVLTGDLNARAEHTTLAPFEGAGLHDAWPATAGPGYTSSAKRPHQRIDYVLAGAELATTAAEVGDAGAGWRDLSDHLPVIVTLAPSTA